MKKLLLEYKDADCDEFGNWCPPLESELIKLYSIHGNELIIALKDCVFELNPDLGSISMLFNDTFISDSSAYRGVYNAMLEIFDDHENKYVRMMVLSV